VTDPIELQREVTRAALAALEDLPFALAGSGAIREHGFIERLSHDVDLFAPGLDDATFGSAIDTVTSTLRSNGYRVDVVRQTESYAQLTVENAGGEAVDVDLAVDWRAQDPVTLAVGPVLSEEDAVGNKVGAAYGRSEPRDFIDIDAIRQSGRFTDKQLLDMAAERDDGFVPEIYAQQIRQISRIPDERFAAYGVAGDELQQLRSRFSAWADQITEPTPASGGPATSIDAAAPRSAAARRSPRPAPHRAGPRT
jgi:hypothetical protein